MSTKTQDISKIGVFSLVMLISGAIDSIRNLPTTALFGAPLIFFFIASAVFFLIPVALISAELAAKLPNEGGIYAWVKQAFGEKLGVFAIWLQWINTVIWYPTILSFIAGTISYIINPSLASNPRYLTGLILVIFWGMTLINLKGLNLSARFASACAVVGMIIPMALIILMGAAWVLSGKPMQIQLSPSHWIPSFSHTSNWTSLTAIMTSFLGMELASVHIRNIKNPQHTYPKALGISVLLILITMILGSLAIAVVIPSKQIGLVSGVMQAFQQFLTTYHLSLLTPLFATILVVGSLGGMINWIISPAKGLLQAAEDGYLPKWLQKTNGHGIASNILILQAIIVSVVSGLFLLLPTVNSAYWLLTDLSTQLNIVMYVLMFISAIKLKKSFNDTKKKSTALFSIPGKSAGFYFTALLGILGCLATIIVGFFPPDNIQYGEGFAFELLFGGGIILMLLPVLYLYYCKRRSS